MMILKYKKNKAENITADEEHLNNEVGVMFIGSGTFRNILADAEAAGNGAEWIGQNIIHQEYTYNINNKKEQELDPILTYERLRKRINLDKEVMNENYDTILKLRKYRTIGFIIISLLSLICMIFPCIYIFNTSNFPGVDSNKDILNMSLFILPFIAVIFASFIGYSFYFYNSIKKETKILLGYSKNMPKVVVKEKFIDSPLFINVVRGVILVTGITFVVLGILNKGFEDVLIKAINICSECIGLA